MCGRRCEQKTDRACWRQRRNVIMKAVVPAAGIYKKKKSVLCSAFYIKNPQRKQRETWHNQKVILFYCISSFSQLWVIPLVWAFHIFTVISSKAFYRSKIKWHGLCVWFQRAVACLLRKLNAVDIEIYKAQWTLQERSGSPWVYLKASSLHS